MPGPGPPARRRGPPRWTDWRSGAQERGGGWTATAGNAVGIIAAAVAAVYLLGGLIFSLRLLLDSVSIPQAASVVGQMSREFLITTGLVHGIGPAAVVGLVAGLAYGSLRRPKHPIVEERPPRPHLRHWPDLRTRTWSSLSAWVAVVLIALSAALVPWVALTPRTRATWLDAAVLAGSWLAWWVVLRHAREMGPQVVSDQLASNTERGAADSVGKGVPTWLALLPLAALFAVPAALLLRAEEDQATLEIGVVLGTMLLNWATAAVAWYALRSIPPGRGSDRRAPNRAERGLLAGLVWTAMALPGSIAFASFLPFEAAEVCLDPAARASTSTTSRAPTLTGVRGRLIADTPRSVLLIGTQGQGGRPIVSVPALQVRHLTFGDAAAANGTDCG